MKGEQPTSPENQLSLNQIGTKLSRCKIRLVKKRKKIGLKPTWPITNFLKSHPHSKLSPPKSILIKNKLGSKPSQPKSFLCLNKSGLKSSSFKTISTWNHLDPKTKVTQKYFDLKTIFIYNQPDSRPNWPNTSSIQSNTSSIQSKLFHT